MKRPPDEEGLAAIPTVQLLGVPVHALTEDAVVAQVVGALSRGRGGMVVTLNLDHLRRCNADGGYRALVTEAELIVPDGVPLLWAGRIAGTRFPGLVAGSNLISSLSRAAALAGRSVFLLGGNPGAAEGAARVLVERSSSLVVAGTSCPPIGFDDDTDRMSRLVADLRAAAPDIVFVGLGSPKQERLIARVRRELPGAWWIGVGISFSYLSGDVRRAPKWMRRAGLEWLHRLASEPGRLARRYVLEGLPFAARLCVWAIARRLRRPAG